MENALNLTNSIKDDKLTVIERVLSEGKKFRLQEVEYDDLVRGMNMSTDTKYRNLSNNLNIFQEFWTISKRTMLNDLRQPLTFVNKIFQ